MCYLIVQNPIETNHGQMSNESCPFLLCKPVGFGFQPRASTVFAEHVQVSGQR